MKTCNLLLTLAAVVCCMCAAACNKDNDTETTPIPVVTPDENTGGGEASGYQFVPLEQYLPGEWRLDPEYITAICPDLYIGTLGWRQFMDNYTLTPWCEGFCASTEESLFFDTEGNYVERRTGREDYVTTYVVGQDSVKVGLVEAGEEELWMMQCFQINADSMIVNPYHPLGVFSMMDGAYLFLRVRE